MVVYAREDVGVGSNVFADESGSHGTVFYSWSSR